ncbi:hypothetical protein D3C77_735380 [compost metagenome]
MAAKIPANLAMSKVFVAAPASAVGAAAVVPTDAAVVVTSSASRVAANFWICSETSVEMRRYGDQKASRMLIALVITLTTVASQSLPSRS